MRQPTSLTHQLKWWRKALKGQASLPIINEPECGFYKVRAWSRGPYIPARIWLEQDIDFETGELADDEICKAEIGETKWDALEAWTWIAGRPVTMKEYQVLMKALPLIKSSGTKAPTYSLV